MAMNCLSILLDRGAAEGSFGYHHHCKDSKLTHLYFADDLLIFCDGSLRSVKNVLQIIQNFTDVSGFAVSISKTSFFSCGIQQPEKDRIISETGITHGLLPVRYLGIPLCTKKLSLANCEPLIQQIKNKVNSWSARSLSFAGRLLLINTVIAGISNFWCSIFTIPKKCIKLINSICGANLWKGTTEGHHSARVSWETVTLSKEEGGLRIRDLHLWNKACTLKLVWLLFFRSGSIWVAWFTKHILRDCKSNFWTIKEKQSHSYAIRKLLRVREYAYSWINIKIEDGASARFWSDNWSPFGNIREFLNITTTSALGIRQNATLADIRYEGGWHIPAPRSDSQLALHTFLTTLTLSQSHDLYEWRQPGNSSQTFKTGLTYNLIKLHQTHVP
ncbi:uncharacterized protein LOC125586954 [Brassica napus]|uniref:uncharacterized protein LOC125586954 n=1 Tax=Brassica napus TaxID=3708 RepID=UPI00207A73CA|nr:uncharacterized protein LOC125586954 [Brassica napus]